MWKPVPQHPFLEAHTDGRIRNAETHHVYATRPKKGPMPYVLTRIQGKTYRVHRLVAMAHIPNPENKRCVAHLDNDPANPAADNLTWATHKENTAHMLQAERQVMPGHAQAITNGVETFPSIKAAIRAGYQRDGLRDALRKGWKHHGRHWSYV